ncbi:1832_t:CDS:2, partial [Ambispora gerdemannii]
TRINDFGMEDVHLEITKQVPVVHNTLSTNVVILKHGDPPNCNKNVHAACKMYRGDLPRGDRLYIACDQAIFARLISYKKINNNNTLMTLWQVKNAHVIKSRKDSLWSLVAKLSSAFGEPNPATHYLFGNAPEISENGIKNILSFYESGKLHFQQILTQDVYKTELRKHKPIQVLTVQQNTSASETSHPKQTRHVTTDAEKTILIQLFRFEDLPPEDAISEVLLQLQTVFSSWTAERIK